MTTTCPRCRHIRQPHEQAPAWQCPACGVAYAKAGESRSPATLSRAAPAQPERRIAWAHWLGLAAIAYGAFAGIKIALKRQGGGDGLASFAGKYGGNASSDDLRTLAAATAPGDVVIYSTSWCPNCKAAKQWMSQQGFAFTECDVEGSASCAAELQAPTTAAAATRACPTSSCVATT